MISLYNIEYLSLKEIRRYIDTTRGIPQQRILSIYNRMKQFYRELGERS